MSLKSLYGTEPRADAAAALGWWSRPACAIGLLFFASYAVLIHRGGRRAVEGIVTGTAFFSSTILLAKAIVIHQLALRDCLLYVRRISCGHRLLRRVALRDVKPHVALYVWISAVALTAPLWPATLIAAAEPTYKFAANIRNIKYSCYQDVAGMGRRELAGGAIFTALLAVLYLRPLKSGGADLQRCKALDALGGEMARGRLTSARLQACGGLDGAIAPGRPLTPRAPYPARRAA